MEIRLDNSLTKLFAAEYMSASFSIVNLRHPDSLDAGSLVTNSALELGAKAKHLVNSIMD
jgi:hypothetical protein